MTNSYPSLSTLHPPSYPVLGCGVGLRPQHYSLVTQTFPQMDWFEAVTENFMDSGGRPLQVLETVRSRYPVALHGVSLSIGSTDPIDRRYLERLKALADRIEPFIVSDHLCWTGVDHENLHDLLPLPFTEEAVDFIARRVDEVQNFIGRRILLENVSSYITYKHSTMPEWEFLTEVARRSGCGILLDLNNIFVNTKNHGFDPERYLEGVPGELVGQFHLGGHTDRGAYLFDTHSAPVIDPVWKLYEKALERYGRVSTLIEWDEAVPAFERLAEEAERARKIYLKTDQVPGDRLESKKDPLTCPPGPGPMSGSLLRLQRDFKTRIQSQSKPAELEASLNPQGGVPGIERADVYAHGYVARLGEALGEVYEAVKHVLGAEAFGGLAESYIAAHPSRDYNLNVVGKLLPDFIGSSAFIADLPFLKDLAALEWRVWEAFHAFHETGFRPEAFASLGEAEWERRGIAFQPSVAIVASAWPILDIWNARQTPLRSLNIPLVDRPQTVLVSRRGLEVKCEAISTPQRIFMQDLISGKTLGEACASLAERSDEEPPLSDWFADWTRAGLIADLL